MKGRLAYAAACVITVAAGLASRRFPALLPAAFGKYPGDALWALMVFYIWGFLAPQWSTARLALGALLTSYADEFTQLYQASWINAIRSTILGHLILGATFSWRDMLAYTAGIAVGVTLNQLLRRGLRPVSS